MTLWIVRAGAEGEQEQSALRNSVVTIDWNMPDLSNLNKKSDLKNLYSKLHPNQNKLGIANSAGQIWDFIHNIRKGDLVVLPLKTQSSESIEVGVVEGGYEYKQLDENIRHFRQVKWIHKISRSEIDQDKQAYLQIPKTVYKVQETVEENLKIILQYRGALPKDLAVREKNLRSKEDIPEIITSFRDWLNSEAGKKHISTIQKEKQEVKELMKKLDSMDKTSLEFIDLVLYALLPYAKTRYAKRVSTFPVFFHIKQFFKNYNYSDYDWSLIAKMIYNMVKQFQNSPDKLNLWIKEFVSDNVHSRSFQCGSISPILFCIDDSFPIVNNRVIHTYNDFATTFGWNDVMSQKLENYLDNIQKCKRLIAELDIPELKNLTIFDEFCYWYDYIFETASEDYEEEDEEDVAFQYELGEKTRIPDIDIPTFLESVNTNTISKFEPQSLRNPERIKINQIIQNCSIGDWVLPNFQRYFDWKRKDVKEFLESVFNDYYVGALLFWDIAKEPQLDIIPIKGVDIRKDELDPTLIILDGQQRITSLYYAVKAPNFALDKSRVPLYFYINFSKFLKNNNERVEVIEVLPRRLSQEESYRKTLFPFYSLEEYDQWVNGFEDFMLFSFQNHLQDKNIQDKIRQIRRIIDRKLKHIIDGFEIPYISLPESMELTQITDIFERINTMGKKLDAFDLLVARLSKYNIQLKKLWEESSKRYSQLINYDRITEKMPIYILQAISLYYNKTSACSREDILNIYENIFEPTGKSFEETWHDMSEYTNKAISKMENLRDGFGVKDVHQLPFSPMIPIVSALLKDIETKQNKSECYKKLSVWYWSSVFSNAYSGAVDSQLTMDFREMRDWFSNNENIPKNVNVARNEFEKLNLRSVRAKGSAIYRGILSILALQGAKDFDTGLTLENSRNNDKDHLFPKRQFGSEVDINSVLNMTWMSDGTNRKIKGYSKPSEYTCKFIDEKYCGKEKDFQEVLQTHFINKHAYECMIKDDFVGFIIEREKAIHKKVGELIGLNEPFLIYSGLISPERPFSNRMLMWNTIKQCDHYIYWIDKYFSGEGLQLLAQSVNKDRLRTIRILTSLARIDHRLRRLFEDFKKEMDNDKVDCEMRVIVESDLSSNIHDRWLISKNNCFNIPSPDIVARGQYSEVKNTENRPPFELWWDASLDILTQWDQIQKKMQEYQSKKIPS